MSEIEDDFSVTSDRTSVVLKTCVIKYHVYNKLMLGHKNVIIFIITEYTHIQMN